MIAALAAIDVVRPTTSTPAAVAADLLAIAGWLSVCVLVAVLLIVPTAGGLARARWVAVGTTAAALAARVVAVLGTVGVGLLQRRVVGAAAVAVVVVLLAVVSTDRVELRRRERRPVVVGLSSLAVAGMAVAGPRAGDAAALLLTAAAATGALAVVVCLFALVARRNPSAVSAGPVLTVVVLAGALVAWPVGVQPSGYSSFTTDVRLADGGLVTVTVAPARPGPNECHLYVFDERGMLTTVQHGTIAVEDEGPVVLTPAGVGHVQALGVAFPSDGDGTWTVTIEATTVSRELRETVEVPSDG